MQRSVPAVGKRDDSSREMIDGPRLQNLLFTALGFASDFIVIGQVVHRGNGLLDHPQRKGLSAKMESIDC